MFSRRWPPLPGPARATGSGFRAAKLAFVAPRLGFVRLGPTKELVACTRVAIVRPSMTRQMLALGALSNKGARVVQGLTSHSRPWPAPSRCLTQQLSGKCGEEVSTHGG